MSLLRQNHAKFCAEVALATGSLSTLGPETSRADRLSARSSSQPPTGRLSVCLEFYNSIGQNLYVELLGSFNGRADFLAITLLYYFDQFVRLEFRNKLIATYFLNHSLIEATA